MLFTSPKSIAELQKGFIDFRYEKQSDKIFIQLKESMLDQPFIFQSSLPRGVGSNDIGLDRGQLGDTRLAVFERYGNKIMLKQLNTQYQSSSNNQAEIQSIDEAFADSIIAGFVIESEADGYIIFDYTAFLFSDIHGVQQRLKATGQGNFSVDTARSAVYLPKSKAFPLNTELEAVVTFRGQPEGEYIRQVTPDAQSVTVHKHHSFIQLPDDNYKPREFHPYSGYFKHSFFDYSVAIDEELEQKMIRRHRLEKKYPDQALSEAKEPIVYYLDPGIPEPVYSALEEGASWWNQAFEAAGFKNAFQVKKLPEGADPMDVRYNIIQWVHRATRGWSYGYSVFDPRTGEILKGHVTLGSLRVRQDLLIALGLTSPFKDGKTQITPQMQLALNRIKQLSAHEVGHTLGLAHNFAASENNRASVMDYPHPMITLENGEIVLANAYDDGIGEWDKYTIAYGYQDFAEQNEHQMLTDMVADAQKTYRYKSDPDARMAHRPSAQGHLWDNGKDPIIEFERMLEVRAFALDKFGIDSLPMDAPWSDLQERLVPLYYSHRYQLDAVVKQIGGLDYEYSVKTATPELPVVSFVAPNVQKQAITQMLRSASAEFLELPEQIAALIPPKAYGSDRTRESAATRMGIAFDPYALAESASAYSLKNLLTAERLNRLSYQHQVNKKIPAVADLLEQLFDDLISDATEDGLAGRVGLIALQQVFTTLKDDTLAPEVKLDIEAALMEYAQKLDKDSRNKKAKVLNFHINNYWRTGEIPKLVTPKTMPPGSPI